MIAERGHKMTIGFQRSGFQRTRPSRYRALESNLVFFSYQQLVEERQRLILIDHKNKTQEIKAKVVDDLIKERLRNSKPE
jgi:hypothetical protein